MIRMRFHHISLTLLVLLFFFSSCSYEDLELKGVESFETGNIENGKVEGLMRVTILNPNSYPITITKADLDVFAAEVRVGDAQLTKNIRIKANSEETYDVKIKANVENLLTGGLGSIVNILSGKAPKISLEGELKARSFLISKTVPVKLETELPLNR